MAYIQYEKQKNVSPATINLRLASISWYFEFLKKEGEVQKNVAKTLRALSDIGAAIVLHDLETMKPVASAGRTAVMGLPWVRVKEIEKLAEAVRTTQ